MDLSGQIITSNDYDDSFDFHPYSYYEADPEPTMPIGKIFDIEKGSLQSTKREEGDYNFITASDTWLTHSEYTHDCEALIFVFGAGGSLGKVHYVNGKFITSDLCYVLTPKNPQKTNLKYFYAYFCSHRKDIVKRLARGTNKKAINDTRLKNYRICHPDISIQNNVGEKVEAIFANVETLKAEIQKEYGKLDTLV